MFDLFVESVLVGFYDFVIGGWEVGLGWFLFVVNYFCFGV